MSIGGKRQTNVALPSKAVIRLGDRSGLACAPSFGNGLQRIILRKRTFFRIAPGGRGPFVIGASIFSMRMLKASFGISICGSRGVMRATLVRKGIGLAVRNYPSGPICLAPSRGFVCSEDSQRNAVSVVRKSARLT